MDEIMKNNYIKLIKFLANVLGENYEIVLHEISDDSSIIAIENSHISGRTTNSPITDFALDVIKSKAYLREDYELNYKASTSNRNVNGSTFFIKDGERLVGMLCINHDDTRAKLALNDLAKFLSMDITINDSKMQSSEKLTTSIEEMIYDVVGEKIEMINNGMTLSLSQKEQTIANLYDKGVFSIKSAVNVVSKMLKISEPSIYRYLKNIKH